MPRSVFKIRDVGTGSFWNGDLRWSKFDHTGKEWRTREAAEQHIAKLHRYGRSFKVKPYTKLDAKWEIVEFQLIEKEVASHRITDLLEYCNVRDKLTEKDSSYGWFYDTMRKRGVCNDIQFIFKLKPADGERRVTHERIKEARAHLRQLGVKTRSFREYNGMFGMMDREQAMKARLTLDVIGVVDLEDIRAKVREEPKAG